MDDERKDVGSLWNRVVSQVKMLLPTEMERNRTERFGKERDDQRE